MAYEPQHKSPPRVLTRPPLTSGPPAQYLPTGHVPRPPAPTKTRRWPGIGVTVAALISLLMFGDAIRIVAVATKAATTTPMSGTAGQQTPVTSDDAASKEQYDLTPGTTLTITAGDGSVQQTTIKSFTTSGSSCDGYGADPENGMLLIADVLVEQKNGIGSVNPLSYTFVAGDGTTANWIGGAFTGCAKHPLDSTDSLQAGQHRAGQLVFDVASAKGAVWLSPGGPGSAAVGSWNAGRRPGHGPS